MGDWEKDFIVNGGHRVKSFRVKTDIHAHSPASFDILSSEQENMVDTAVNFLPLFRQWADTAA
jgi:hypothetical protein